MTCGKSVPGLKLFVLLLAASLCLGCADEDETTKSKRKPKRNAKTSAKSVAKPRAPIVGQPVGAGILDEVLTLQTGREPADRKSVVAAETRAFLLVVRLDVNAQKQTLVPADYRVAVGGRQFTPLGVAFGKTRHFYLSTKEFLDDKIILTHESAGRMMIREDDNKVTAAELDRPELVLLYKIEGSDDVELRHGHDRFPLTVVDSPHWAKAPKAAAKSANLTPLTELDLKVEKGVLAVAELDGEKIDVYDLTLKLKTNRTTDLEITPGNLYLLGGKKRTRKFVVDFDEKQMLLLRGSVYSDIQYEGKKAIQIHSGGVQLLVAPGRPLTLQLAFAKPPIGSGLRLIFPDQPPIELIAPTDRSGQIRPAALDSIRKVAIPNAPIIGKLVRVAIIGDAIDVVSEVKQRLTNKVRAAPGTKFLMLKFNVAEADQQFVANDYVVVAQDGSKQTAKYVSFGKTPARRIPGDGYSPVRIVHGKTDRQRLRKGVLSAWELATPEFLILYQTPQSSEKFTFQHGSTVLTLQPASTTVAWSDIRPMATKSPSKTSKRPKTKTKNKPIPRPASKATKEQKAKSALKLAKAFAKKNPAKARDYAQKVIQLVPGSDLAKQAKALLDELK